MGAPAPHPEVLRSPEGDAHYPPIPIADFVETARDAREQLAWVTYDRREP